MDNIFHEKQEGYLCAQHCLNALLQGPYFNAVDLANLAQQMDEEERIRMAESGIDSEEYRHFLEQPSENMDDSGYFSVQVISSALKVWGLELMTYSSSESTALIAQNDPSQMRAYICNYKGHWFTIRKIGRQWFNLNSILSGPQLLSDTHLAMFFAQLLQEGYSIFIVIGDLSPCPADDILLRNPVPTTPKAKSQIQTSSKPSSAGYRLGSIEDESTKIQRAVSALERVQVPKSSMSSTQLSSTSKMTNPRERIVPIVLEGHEETYAEDDDANLQKALQLSLQDDCEITDKSLKSRLNINDGDSEVLDNGDEDDDDEDDDDLRKALKLSLECVTAPTTPDPEDLRWRRLAYLGITSRTSNNESKLNT